MENLYDLPTQLSFNFKDEKNVTVKIVFSGLYVNIYPENMSLLCSLMAKNDLSFSNNDDYISVRISSLTQARNIDFLNSTDPEWLVLKKIINFNERGLLPFLSLSSPKELMVELKWEGRKQLYFTRSSFFDSLYGAGIKFQMEYKLEEYFKENILPFSHLGVARQSNDTHWEITIQSPSLVKYLKVEGLFIINSLMVGVPGSLSWQLLEEKKIWVINPENLFKPNSEAEKFQLNKAGILIGNSLNDFKAIIQKEEEKNILIIVDEEKLLYWEVWLERNIEGAGEMNLILTNLNGLDANTDYHSNELIIIDLHEDLIFDNYHNLMNICSDLTSTVIYHFKSIDKDKVTKVLSISKAIEFPVKISMESVSLVSMKHSHSHLYEYLSYSDHENSISLTMVPVNEKYTETIKSIVERKDLEELKKVYFEGADEEINPLILHVASRANLEENTLIVVGNENMKVLLGNIRRDLTAVTEVNDEMLKQSSRLIVLGYSKNIGILKSSLNGYTGFIEIILLANNHYRDMMIYVDSFLSNKVINSLSELELDRYFETLV